MIPPPRPDQYKGEAQPANLIAMLITALVTIVGVAQLFRNDRLQRRQDEDGAAKLAERDLLLRELEHRMKNNFQTVASLIELQLRRANDEPAKLALREALNRVISISNAHRNLYAASDERAVNMGVYLKDLCANLADALFLGELVRLECRVEAGALDRDRAVAIGLIVNELVTNAAKHAFADGRPGQIRVAFARQPSGYIAWTVEDDGSRLARGLRHPPPRARARPGRSLHPSGRRLADRRRGTGRAVRRRLRGLTPSRGRSREGGRCVTPPAVGRRNRRRSSACRSRAGSEVGALDRGVAGVNSSRPHESRT